MTKIFHTIFEDSIRAQENYLTAHANQDAEGTSICVAFEGDTSSYSHVAAQQYFAGQQDQLTQLGCGSFKEAVTAVESGQADFAVLPIENTTSGGINEVYDLLVHTTLHIVGEERVAVDHCLLASHRIPVGGLQKLYGHPQAVAQCNRFLAGLRDCEIVYVETSEAVRRIRDEKPADAAAIAGTLAAKNANLTILEADIANQKENYTRFLIASRKARTIPLQVPCKISLVMATEQKPGALVDALLLFKERGIGMVKLESRPILGNPWEEMFYIDLEGNLENPHIEEALEELGRVVRFSKVLGCYASRDLPKTRVDPDRLGA